MEIPVEISARHVHLSKADKDALFGTGYTLTRKRDLSQPGQYLCEERVKLVTQSGEIANVAVLGPERKETQVELSLTDARVLGLKPPIRLSGDLRGAADVIIVGPKGVITAKGSVIVAKAHVHMTPDDAKKYGVEHGQSVSIRMGTERSVTLNDVQIRVSKDFALAVHIDYDEANAAQVSGGKIVGQLLKNG
ncbi:MAG: phosphate propanoyltransferase [Oscillospiraceae bacterium]|nr:phosphate propanoyltransferase [Oscillospiraceae bacterium]